MRRDDFRPDIEGLRAVAIGLVLLYHTGAPWAGSGFMGVDVFFVLSGFLITTVLLGEIERTGRISLPNFWARRARRLLPAAMLALVFAAAVTWTLLPITQRQTFGGDVVAAAGYVVNWELLARSVDYLAEDVGSSPVQHYWSLAVEEQFYVLWPILLAAVLWWTSRDAQLRERAILVAAGTVVGVSFAISVVSTAASPAASYFSTFSRLWEIGIGVVVAVLATRLRRLPVPLLRAAGWAGLALLIVGVLTLTTQTPWPGFAALLPTLGAAGLIVAGLAPGGLLQRALGVRPMVFVGGISYSLYLWHWPMLVGARAAWGDIGLLGSGIVAAASVIPAWLSRRFVEDPIRYSAPMRRPRIALPVGAVCSIVAALAGVLTINSIGPVEAAFVPPVASAPPGAAAGGSPASNAAASALPNGSPAPTSATPHLGAAALLDPTSTIDWGTINSVDRITPNPFTATDDVPQAVTDGCQEPADSNNFHVCTYGIRDASRVLLLAGDSKAVQWAPAFDAVARAAGWRLEIVGKSACTFTDALLVYQGANYDGCTRWNSELKQWLLANPPTVLVVNGGATSGIFQGSALTSDGLAAGYAHLWTDLSEAGIHPIVLLDNAGPPAPVYECVAEHPTALSTCAFDFASAAAGSGAVAQAAAAAEVGLPVMDLRSWICPHLTVCPAVIGDVLVYRQGSHLTATYITTLAPMLSDALWTATGGQLGQQLPAAGSSSSP